MEKAIDTNSKPKLLLHICCAPDAAYAAPLMTRGYDVYCYFYNPNIHPRAEYEKRLNEMVFLANKFGLKLITGEYDVENWLDFVSGYEDEPEGGIRCEKCEYYRFRNAAEKAVELGIENFTTVLTNSTRKNAEVINRLGTELAKKYGLNWIETNFKKKKGNLFSVRISRYLNLYRQNYCGCVYSLREQEVHAKAQRTKKVKSGK